jgi:hypothetical protein
MTWKAAAPIEPNPEPTENIKLVIRSGDVWVAWDGEGKVTYSEGYDPKPETRALFALLGPLAKEHIRRPAPPSTGRKRRKWGEGEGDGGGDGV